MGEELSHYIEFRHVYKTFDKPVLIDTNFHVDAGETVAIIGRSGVGKSVTLGHIMGFLKPDSGQIIVAHEDITNYPESELRRIHKKVTMVFQSGALFDSLTIGENVLFSLELRDDYDAKNKEDVVDGLLHMMDIYEYKDAFPSDFSTGSKGVWLFPRASGAPPAVPFLISPPPQWGPHVHQAFPPLIAPPKSRQPTAWGGTHDLALMRKVADRGFFSPGGRRLFLPPPPEPETPITHSSRSFWRWTKLKKFSRYLPR